MTTNVQTQPSVGVSSMTDMYVKDYTKFLSWYFMEIFGNIDIRNYSSSISNICLIFMAMKPDTFSFRPDKNIWRRKTHTFDMYVNVPDYEAFCNASETQARQIIANLFLQSIEKYLSKRKDIDFRRLYDDVKSCLIQSNSL